MDYSFITCKYMAKFPFDCTETRQGPVDCNPGEREMNNVEGLSLTLCPGPAPGSASKFPKSQVRFHRAVIIIIIPPARPIQDHEWKVHGRDGSVSCQDTSIKLEIVNTIDRLTPSPSLPAVTKLASCPPHPVPRTNKLQINHTPTASFQNQPPANEKKVKKEI